VIYRQGLALYNVRVVDRFSGVLAPGSAPFVLGNTIYLKGAIVDPTVAGATPEVLVHESVHV
jgi:hypothetical protein